MFGTGWVNKVFSLRTFIKIYLKHSACVWLTSGQDLKVLSESD